MLRRFLKAKIHRATVTQTELHYEGSITIDPELLEQADIKVNEQVDIYNITSGTRLTTYAIEGQRGSGDMCVNGAAAHLVNKGDMIIVCSYCDLHQEEIDGFKPIVLLVDEKNKVVRKAK